MKKLQTTHKDGKRDENLRLQHQADKCRGPVNNSAGPKPTFFLFQFLQFRLIRIRNTEFLESEAFKFLRPCSAELGRDNRTQSVHTTLPTALTCPTKINKQHAHAHTMPTMAYIYTDILECRYQFIPQMWMAALKSCISYKNTLSTMFASK